MNAVREATKHMQANAPAHQRSVNVLIGFLSRTKNRGWKLMPKRKWDKKDKLFEFRISGKPDSDYATCTHTRKSVTGYMVWFEGTLIAVRSVMQKVVAISTVEAELIALVMCIQEMMYLKKLVEALELKVELPMKVECDNKSTVDLVNGQFSAGGTKHIDVKLMYARELKDAGVIKVMWIPTESNEADILTKNMEARTFNRHSGKFMSQVPSEQGGV